MKDIKCGDIIWADLSGAKYSEQGKVRPVLIVQNNIGNKYSPTTIVLPLTSNMGKKPSQPTHVVIKTTDAIGLDKDSMVLCEQVRAIDKKRLGDKIGKVCSKDVIDRVFVAYINNFRLQGGTA